MRAVEAVGPVTSTGSPRRSSFVDLEITVHEVAGAGDRGSVVDDDVVLEELLELELQRVLETDELVHLELLEHLGPGPRRSRRRARPDLEDDLEILGAVASSGSAGRRRAPAAILLEHGRQRGAVPGDLQEICRSRVSRPHRRELGRKGAGQVVRPQGLEP